MKSYLKFIVLPIVLVFANSASATIVNFNTDGNGNTLNAGTIIDNEYSALGLTVYGQSNRVSNNSTNVAMIFNSASPTGGDFALGTPNGSLGGAGIGNGGNIGAAGQNDIALGNILILSEDLDMGDPDDEAQGGILKFIFNYDVLVGTIGILSGDASVNESVKLYDASNVLIQSFAFANVGYNGFQEIELQVAGVRSMDVIFSGSGAVTGFTYTAVPAPSAVVLFGLGLIGVSFIRRRRTTT